MYLFFGFLVHCATTTFRGRLMSTSYLLTLTWPSYRAKQLLWCFFNATRCHDKLTKKNNLGTSELWWKTEVWRCKRDDRHRLDGCYTWKLRSGKEVHWMQGLYLSNSISSDIFQLCINKIWNQKSILISFVLCIHTFWIVFWLVMIWDYKKHPHPIDRVKRQIFECNILFVENLAYCE